MQKKNFFIAAAVSLCLLAVISHMYVISIRETLFRESALAVMEIAEQGAARFDCMLNGQKNLLKAFASIWEADRPEVRVLLDDMKRMKRFFGEDGVIDLRVIDAEGHVRAASGKDAAELTDDPYFRQALTQNKAWISEPFYDPLTGLKVVGLYQPLVRDGKVLAVARLSLLKNSLSDACAVTFYNGRGYSHVISRTGKKLLDSAHGDSNKTFANVLDLGGSDKPDSPWHRLKQNLLDRRKGSLSLMADDMEKFLCYVPLQSNSDWFFVTVVPEKVMREYSITAVTYSALFCFLILLLSLLVFGVFFRERKKYEHHVHELAYTDPLTGLPNKNFIRERLGKLLKNDVKGALAFAVFDISHFKLVNELLGYDTGTKMLISLAEQTRQLLRPSEQFVRIGNDQFAAIVDCPGEAELQQRLETLFAALGRYFEKSAGSAGLSFSCGVCVIGGSQTVEQLFTHANIARQIAKTRNMQHSVIFFHQDILHKMEEEKKLEDTMRMALERGEFHFFLQPKVNTRTSRIIGAEALVRWLHPETGIIPPDDFVPLFERNGFIVDLDYAILEQVCRTKRRWLDTGFPDTVISVNMSRRHFEQEQFVERVVAITDMHGIRRNSLEIEITETAFVEESGDISELMYTLKRAGFRISMDDFGTGYSSLNLLRKIPIDVLKLDRAFLDASEMSMKGKAIIRNIMRMAQDIDVMVICEGVETPEQNRFLQNAGCWFVQGYLYAKPMPVELFETFVYSWDGRGRGIVSPAP